MLTLPKFHFIYIFTLFSVFINNTSLYNAFAFTSKPIIVGFILFSDLLTPLDAVVKLLMNILSRTYEFQADAFAVGLGHRDALARSLIRLQIQNLSTMDADPIFASYHYSHPILAERLAALGWKPEEKVGEKDEVVKASGREEL